jgi:hypothetical protein
MAGHIQDRLYRTETGTDGKTARWRACIGRGDPRAEAG